MSGRPAQQPVIPPAPPLSLAQSIAFRALLGLPLGRAPTFPRTRPSTGSPSPSEPACRC